VKIASKTPKNPENCLKNHEKTRFFAIFAEKTVFSRH